MRKATAIYHAPDGDADICQMSDVVFKDGDVVELNSTDNEHLINKLQYNQHFEVDVGEDDGTKAKRKLGRPTNAEKAAKEAAEKVEEVE